ncbi:hypothetical protein GVN16_02980 [Emticicia sp. CRIBPO]|uniref:hypothetical protein n=1 Tax=Emticicia sp. CRIBPO TaxID=2683258 RepID=UPI00141333D2|nr:hypothetical protein [Emticicia sp. CRIBPO]NBA84703.1 hypothetical protein [Emticicia sp. CRIBPO]
MKTIEKPVRLAKLGFLLLLISGTSILYSCEKNDMSPQNKPDTFADDDPPKDDRPKPPPTT